MIKRRAAAILLSVVSAAMAIVVWTFLTEQSRSSDLSLAPTSTPDVMETAKLDPSIDADAGQSLPLNDDVSDLDPDSDSEQASKSVLRNPVAADEFYRRADELSLCAEVRAAMAPARRDKVDETVWRWLPTETADRERKGLDEAIEHLATRCATVPMATSKEIEQIHQSAAQLGHPLARLQARRWDVHTPESLAETRALIDEVLRSERLEDIARLGEALPMLSRELADTGMDAALWQLIACDLGMPCERGSAAWNRSCIDSVAACGTEHLQGQILDAAPERLIPYFQLRRARLVEMMRRRDFAAVLRELVPNEG